MSCSLATTAAAPHASMSVRRTSAPPPIMSTPSAGPASPVRDKGVYACLLAG
jgi:hypothetical protein